MKTDNLYLYALMQELDYLNQGARIEKIHQPTQYEITLNVRTKKGNKKLLISIHPETFRFHMTTRAFENPKQPKGFCVVLRKYLEGGVITKVEQLYHDRIIRLTIQSYNAVGDLVEYFLYTELMGKYSNLILVDQDEKIIDALKRVDITKSEYREVLPKLKYYLPALHENPQEFKFYLQPFLKAWLKQNNFTEEVLLLHAQTPKGYYYKLVNGKAIYSFLAIDAVIDIKEVLTFDTLSEAIDLYYYEQTIAQQLREKTMNLLHFVNQTVKRNDKKIKKLTKELHTAENYEQYQMIGNLLLAQQYTLSDYQKEVTLDNYYVEPLDKIHVQLNEQKTIVENAQQYFKKYTKAKTAIEKLQEQIQKTQAEINYFDTITQSLAHADLKQADEIREELVIEGYFKQKGTIKKQKKVPQFSTYHFAGVDYLVGKNNLQNDYVTFKMRRRDYTWLHVKDFPGSHVLITKKGTLDEDKLVAGALLAAYFSKMRESDNVAVDYTFVQHVSKPSGAKSGFVIYREQKTLYVTPSLTNMQKYFNDFGG